MLQVCSLDPFATERWSRKSHSCFVASFSNQTVAGNTLGPHNPECQKAMINQRNHSTMFVQSFNKCLSIAYYVPVIVPGAKDINKRRFLPSQRFFQSGVKLRSIQFHLKDREAFHQLQSYIPGFVLPGRVKKAILAFKALEFCFCLSDFS